MSSPECTGCQKGLVFMAKVVISNNEAKIKRLRLCSSCRSVLMKSIKDL